MCDSSGRPPGLTTLGPGPAASAQPGLRSSRGERYRPTPVITRVTTGTGGWHSRGGVLPSLPPPPPRREGPTAPQCHRDEWGGGTCRRVACHRAADSTRRDAAGARGGLCQREAPAALQASVSTPDFPPGSIWLTHACPVVRNPRSWGGTKRMPARRAREGDGGGPDAWGASVASEGGRGVPAVAEEGRRARRGACAPTPTRHLTRGKGGSGPTRSPNPALLSVIQGPLS